MHTDCVNQQYVAKNITSVRWDKKGTNVILLGETTACNEIESSRNNQWSF